VISLLVVGIVVGRALERAEDYEVTYLGFERVKELTSR